MQAILDSRHGHPLGFDGGCDSPVGEKRRLQHGQKWSKSANPRPLHFTGGQKLGLRQRTCNPPVSSARKKSPLGRCSVTTPLHAPVCPASRSRRLCAMQLKGIRVSSNGSPAGSSTRNPQRSRHEQNHGKPCLAQSRVERCRRRPFTQLARRSAIKDRCSVEVLGNTCSR